MNKFDIIRNALIIASAFLICCLSSQAKGLPENRMPSPQMHGVYKGTSAIRDITYKIADGETLQFDIAYPNTEAPKDGFPLLVYLHGGGWSGGDRFEGYGFFNDEIRFYNSQGIAVASASYRFVNEDLKRTIADCVTDVKDALRFMVKNADTLKIDPRKIGVYGHSAGGHLTMMAVLTGDSDFKGDPSLADVKVKAVCAVPMSGPTSFIDPASEFDGETRFSDPSNIKRFLGGETDPEKVRIMAKAVSPAEYLSKDSPKMLVITGEKDSLVSQNAAIYLGDRAKKVGAPVEVFIAEGAEHSFENGDHVEILEKRRAFILENLK